jgi:hypothetical protein
VEICGAADFINCLSASSSVRQATNACSIAISNWFVFQNSFFDAAETQFR